MACSSPHSYNSYNNHNTENTAITTASQNAPSTRSSLRSVFTVSPPETPSPSCPPFRPSPPEQPCSNQCPAFPSHPAPHVSRKWKSWRDYLFEIAKEPAVVDAQGVRGRGGEEDEREGDWLHVSCPDTAVYMAFVPGVEQENAKMDEGAELYNSESKGAIRRATMTTAPESEDCSNAVFESNASNDHANANTNGQQQYNDQTVQRFQQTLAELSSLQNRLVTFLSPPPCYTTTSITTSTSASRITALRPLLQTFATTSHNAGRREALNEVYTHLITRVDPATSTSHATSKMMLGAAERAILRREAEFVNRLAGRKDGVSKKMDEKKRKENNVTRRGEDEDEEKYDMEDVEEFVGGLEGVLRDVLVVLERVLERSDLGLHY